MKTIDENTMDVIGGDIKNMVFGILDGIRDVWRGYAAEAFDRAVQEWGVQGRGGLSPQRVSVGGGGSETSTPAKRKYTRKAETKDEPKKRKYVRKPNPDAVGKDKKPGQRVCPHDGAGCSRVKQCVLSKGEACRKWTGNYESKLRTCENCERTDKSGCFACFRRKLTN